MATRIDPNSAPRRRDAFRPRIIIAVSIPVYLALAILLYSCWPNYWVFALIPVCFAAHSAGYLISARKE